MNTMKSKFYVLYDPATYKILATTKMVTHVDRPDVLPGHPHWVCIEEPRTLNTILPGMYYNPEKNTFTGVFKKVEAQPDPEEHVILKSPDMTVKITPPPVAKLTWWQKFKAKFRRK